MMGRIRDFRAETIENIRENLVDDENAGNFWDDFGDFFRGLFKSNATLNEDLSNFDKYMHRICELNDITTQKLKSIIDDVHSMENIYQNQLDVNAYNLNQLVNMMSALCNEIGNEDFEKSFDRAFLDTTLGMFVLRDMPLDFSGLSPEALGRALSLLDNKELEEVLKRLPTQTLCDIDWTSLSIDQQYLYFSEIHARLLDPNLSVDSLERQLLSNAFSLIPHDIAMKIVYNSNGQYGGNQGAPQRNPNDPLILSILQQYPDLMNTYCPNMDPAEIRQFLSDFNSVGCGYVAMANTIFVEYAGRPDDFERTFGFPMYNSNGNLNFNALSIDIYCYANQIGHGTLPSERKIILEGYASNKGVSVSVTNNGYTPTVSNLQDALEKGSVIMRINPSVMYDSSGNPTSSWTATGGHAIVVTGVDSNGIVTVSSWGKEYTVDLSEINKYSIISYEVVTYGN